MRKRRRKYDMANRWKIGLRGMLLVTAAIAGLIWLLMYARYREAELLIGVIVGGLAGQLWTGKLRSALAGAALGAALASGSDLAIKLGLR